MFLGWLEHKPPQEVVGRALVLDQCPFSIWLKDYLHTHKQVRTLTTRSYEVGNRWYTMPWWAAEFVATIDHGRPYNAPILAVDALEVLRDIDERNTL
jgi:hypothetical protein